MRVWVHVVDCSRITTATTRYHIHDWTASQNNSQRIELNVLKLENWSLFCSTPVTRTFDSFMVYYFPLKFNFFPRVICRHSSTPIYIQIIFRQPQHAHIHRSPNVWREYWGNRLINRHTLELTMATFRTSWQTHTTNQLNGIATVGATFERNRTVKQQYLITSLAGWIKLWATKRERKKNNYWFLRSASKVSVDDAYSVIPIGNTAHTHIKRCDVPVIFAPLSSSHRVACSFPLQLFEIQSDTCCCCEEKSVEINEHVCVCPCASGWRTKQWIYGNMTPISILHNHPRIQMEKGLLLGICFLSVCVCYVDLVFHLNEFFNSKENCHHHCIVFDCDDTTEEAVQRNSGQLMLHIRRSMVNLFKTYSTRTRTK